MVSIPPPVAMVQTGNKAFVAKWTCAGLAPICIY